MWPFREMPENMCEQTGKCGPSFRNEDIVMMDVSSTEMKGIG
jgi:hypothetical protein